MIEFKKKAIDFASVFEARCQSAWFRIQKPNVTYSVDNPYNHFVVEVDEQYLSIIIEKVITNAAQYTSSGHVRARYDYTGDHLVMAFQDSGCGISPDLQEHIFDRFINNEGQGTGLGLSIVHELVSQMGGKINIKSEVGKGTIVWVTIPCKVIELERK
jgi:signal transduction histidine kinase